MYKSLIYIFFISTLLFADMSALCPIQYKGSNVAKVDELNRKLYLLNSAGQIITNYALTQTQLDGLRSNWTKEYLYTAGYVVSVNNNQTNTLLSTTVGKGVSVKDTFLNVTKYSGQFYLPTGNVSALQGVSTSIVAGQTVATVNSIRTGISEYNAASSLNVNAVIESGSKTIIMSTKSISLKPGFRAKAGSNVRIAIEKE